MSINWKVRLRSGPFWVGVISLALTAIYSILNLCGVIPEIGQAQIMDAIIPVLQLVAAIGVITDPTTKGIEDSEQAMNYKEPK